MIQALFDNEVDAFKGLQALQQLDLTKDISLGETYVLTKDENGKSYIRSAKDKNEGNNTISGGLLGGLVGLLAGPLGLVVGVAGGMLIGTASETLNAEQVSDYLDEVAANIPDGKSVLLAHVWEDWETPVDTVLLPIGADLKRFNIDHEIFVPVKNELDKVNEDIKEAETRFLEAEGADKADWNITLAELRNRRDALQHKLNHNVDQQETVYNNWIAKHDTSEYEEEEKNERLSKRIQEQKNRLEQLKKFR